MDVVTVSLHLYFVFGIENPIDTSIYPKRNGEYRFNGMLMFNSQPFSYRNREGDTHDDINDRRYNGYYNHYGLRINLLRDYLPEWGPPWKPNGYNYPFNLDELKEWYDDVYSPQGRVAMILNEDEAIESNTVQNPYNEENVNIAQLESRTNYLENLVGDITDGEPIADTDFFTDGDGYIEEGKRQGLILYGNADVLRNRKYTSNFNNTHYEYKSYNNLESYYYIGGWRENEITTAFISMANNKLRIQNNKTKFTTLELNQAIYNNNRISIVFDEYNCRTILNQYKGHKLYFKLSGNYDENIVINHSRFFAESERYYVDTERVLTIESKINQMEIQHLGNGSFMATIPWGFSVLGGFLLSVNSIDNIAPNKPCYLDFAYIGTFRFGLEFNDIYFDIEKIEWPATIYNPHGDYQGKLPIVAGDKRSGYGECNTNIYQLISRMNFLRSILGEGIADVRDYNHFINTPNVSLEDLERLLLENPSHRHISTPPLIP